MAGLQVHADALWGKVSSWQLAKVTAWLGRMARSSSWFFSRMPLSSLTPSGFTSATALADLSARPMRRSPGHTLMLCGLLGGLRRQGQVRLSGAQQAVSRELGRRSTSDRLPQWSGGSVFGAKRSSPKSPFSCWTASAQASKFAGFRWKAGPDDHFAQFSAFGPENGEFQPAEVLPSKRQPAKVLPLTRPLNLSPSKSVSNTSARRACYH